MSLEISYPLYWRHASTLMLSGGSSALFGHIDAELLCGCNRGEFKAEGFEVTGSHSPIASICR
jgi:hypothetical protein